jgi:hypothetical protein
MASNIYTRDTVDGQTTYSRKGTQGRKPSGLGTARKHRLYLDDEMKLDELKKNLGQYYNENEIVRTAVRIYLSNSVGTELVNP